MEGLQVLFAALVILLVPVAASHGRVKPRSLSQLSVASTLLASTIVLVTLTICASASVEAHFSSSTNGESGDSMRHLIPALPLTGWASLAILTATLVMVVSSLHVTMRRRRALQFQLAFADIRLIDDVPVATVPTGEFVAAAVSGPRSCVIMSQGARRQLSEPEMKAVIHHEDAHLRLGHHRHLLLARALDRSLWFVPGMRQAVRSLRMSLELEADACARDVVGPLDVGRAIRRGHEHGNQMALRRQQALRLTSRSARSATVAWVVLAGIGVAAICLEYSWLGSSV